MNPDVSERAFEEAIEAALLRYGPDSDADLATAGTLHDSDPGAPDILPGGYRKRLRTDYDPALCLIPKDVLDFILATQPKEWKRLQQHHGERTREQFLLRLSSEIAQRGTLEVLRDGVKESGCKLKLGYFRPASGLNAETRNLHAANLFSVVRQLRYRGETGEPSGAGSLPGEQGVLDLVLFLNGLPLFTAELKNKLSGQDVRDAIEQYKTSRDPREPLLAYGRCLAHFAVDPELAYVTSHLAKGATRFLPFNQGWNKGAGNPPVPPSRGGYATRYLWEETWARDSVLDLVRNFIQEIEEEDERGKKTGRRHLIFPRYHQVDCVRKLVADSREHGTGQRYLIQHSAGSGKSLTLGWLAHRLSTLHDRHDQKVFDSIVVVTDRRILDRQLQTTLRQLEQTLGVVENIDKTSKQLREALEEGKTIIVTTLQKFPVISREIGELPGKRFALIVDEAHSSQSGESTKSLKAVLSASTLEAAEQEEAGAESPEEELDDAFLAEAEKRRQPPNLSTFAFTATPKPKTLELFGRLGANGKPEPFHLYSMRQAIEEGFILDVLANYTTYKAYWRLLKKVEDDPRYDKKKAEYLLRAFVDLSPHAIREKVRVMVEHFAAQSQGEIGGRAKAMVVTRSRLHAVLTKLEIDAYLRERGYPWRALVAFSGKVEAGGVSYTEAGMNGFPEGQTAKTFGRPEYRFLVVANKFQTGFDQPLLHTMYVDKKLGGVNAVQTLSRLNRTLPPEKTGTAVLDFANEAHEIQTAFKDFYQATFLSETTDPNLPYEIQRRLAAFPVYTEAEVNAYARLYRDNVTQDRLYSALAPCVARFRDLEESEQRELRGLLNDYVRLYAFVSQVLPFSDADLEKLYVFARHLRRVALIDEPKLPVEVQQAIDMESYRLQRTSSGKIPLERRNGVLDPIGSKGSATLSLEEMEPLSLIIADLNERFGLHLGPEHRKTIGQMLAMLDDDDALDAAARTNTRDNVRLSFGLKVEQVIQEIVDTNFDLYKKVTDDRDAGEALKNALFELYLRVHRNAEVLIQQGESKTVEFKSTLRWNLKEDRQDDKQVTHAVLKTVAAFLNTEGGELLIGVADDRSLVGLEPDRLETEDKFMRHLTQVVRNGLGDRAGTCIDPKTQVVQDKTVCVVACQKSPEPVFLRWKGMEATPEGDFYVRQGPGSVKLSPESAQSYIRTRFAGA